MTPLPCAWSSRSGSERCIDPRRARLSASVPLHGLDDGRMGVPQRQGAVPRSAVDEAVRLRPRAREPRGVPKTCAPLSLRPRRRYPGGSVHPLVRRCAMRLFPLLAVTLGLLAPAPDPTKDDLKKL